MVLVERVELGRALPVHGTNHLGQSSRSAATTAAGALSALLPAGPSGFGRREERSLDVEAQRSQECVALQFPGAADLDLLVRQQGIERQRGQVTFEYRRVGR